jgi:hypothetical protein
MMKLTPQMVRHLHALEAGPRGAYPGLSLRTLDALYMRGLVTRAGGVGQISFPHTAIKWSLNSEGRAALSKSQQSVSEPGA